MHHILLVLFVVAAVGGAAAAVTTKISLTCHSYTMIRTLLFKNNTA